jgi:phosphopantothenoylcysteine decarboxylase/phosphopantothenate--cysteine ligase
VFGAEDNQAVILGADGSRRDVPTGTKAALAHAVWDEVARRLAPLGEPG